MTTTRRSDLPKIDRLKDGADQIGKLFANEGTSSRVEVGIVKWERLETEWRTGSGTGCPMEPERCGDAPRCQFCKGLVGSIPEPEPSQVPLLPMPAGPPIEDIVAELKSEVLILAGTWGTMEIDDSEELKEMLAEGIEAVDTLMMAYFALGGDGCPLDGCHKDAVVRCKICAGD